MKGANLLTAISETVDYENNIRNFWANVNWKKSGMSSYTTKSSADTDLAPWQKKLLEAKDKFADTGEDAFPVDVDEDIDETVQAGTELEGRTMYMTPTSTTAHDPYKKGGYPQRRGGASYSSISGKSRVVNGVISGETGVPTKLYYVADNGRPYSEAETYGAVLLCADEAAAKTVSRKSLATQVVKNWFRLIGKAALFGFAPSLINGLLYEDDDEWEDIKKSDKDTNYLFKLQDGLWLKIPKGRTLSLLGMTADRVKDVAKGKSTTKVVLFCYKQRDMNAKKRKMLDGISPILPLALYFVPDLKYHNKKEIRKGKVIQCAL